MANSPTLTIDRRAFLRTTGAGLITASVGLPLACAGTKAGTQPPAAQTAQTLGIKHYNILGRTNLKVSDVSVGAARIGDPAVVEYALDLGINFFDTAESYGSGRSESTLGQVAASKRDKMVICTKLLMDGKTTKQDVISRLEQCLKRLQSDYVDILMIHTGNPDALDNPQIHEAMSLLRQQGKMRFSGVSHHGPNMTAALTPVVEKDMCDVLLCSFDPVTYPDLDDFFARAEAKKMGIVAMKVISSAPAANLQEVSSGKFPLHQAALRWCLRNKYVDCAIPSVSMMDQLDEFVVASGAGQQTAA